MGAIYTITDYSEHQGKINHEKAKGAIDGCIIRTGYGDDISTQDDKYAKYNMDECERLGIPYFTYLYSYAGNARQNRSEIAHEERMTKGRKTLGHVLDLEEWDLRENGRAAAEAWLAAFPDNGYIYAGQAWWNGPLKGLECHRWIPAYGNNSGKPEAAYKPKMTMDGWQYTSRGRIAGVNGNVDISEWYTDAFTNAPKEKTAEGPRVVYKKDVAVLIMIHLVTHSAHGYTQDMKGRQGTGTEVLDIYGHKYTIPAGDADCSSAVIRAYEAAGISCGGATYTGNMRKCMVASGNFEVKPMSYIAQSGDTYLNEKSHTAMCISAEPDILAEFSINEKGGVLGGKLGDQKQVGEYDDTLGRGESHLADYYDYPWDLILKCKNKEVAFVIDDDAEEKTTTTPAKATVTHDTALCAALTILGEYGNGEARKKALGARWEPVQAVVDKTLLKHRAELAEAMAKFIETL